MVVVPPHWTQQACRSSFMRAAGDSRYGRPDLEVLPGLLHGSSRPFTSQSRGCGAPGDFTAIPLQFILDYREEGYHHKLLAHEFLKLRFGIFDELGYPGDEVYPHYFIQHNRVLPTGMTDGNMTGSWVSLDGDNTTCMTDIESCYFQIENRARQPQCSLGTNPQLASVHKYCEGINLAAPTKHNALCHGQPVEEVIRNSPDLTQLRETGPSPGSQLLPPHIVTVQEKYPRYILVVETSSSMADNDDWRWVNKALQKLLRYDLPDSAMVGLVTFSDVSKVEVEVTRLGEHRSELADILPDKYRLGGGQTCVVCGLTAALETLGRDKQGGHIVLITRAATLKERDERKMKEFFSYYQAKLSTVMISSSGVVRSPVIYDELARHTGGHCYLVSQIQQISRYREISKALSEVTEVSQVLLHEQLVSDSVSGEVTEGDFLVDKETAATNLTFAVFVRDEENHAMRSVSFTNLQTGQQFGPYTAVSSLQDNVNMKTFNYGLVSGAPPFSRGSWRYHLQWVTQDREAAVTVTAGVSDRARGFNIRVWSSADRGDSVVTSHHPLSLHASVSLGGDPVLRAQVTATVTLLAQNASQPVEVASFQLLDNGNGDADVVRNDGVYSRYLVDYHQGSPGRYSVSVVVRNEEETAVVAHTQDYLPRTQCCGSRTNVDLNSATKLGRFRRTSGRSLNINLAEVPNMAGSDLMPPGTILDLRVRRENSRLSLNFTAPGDDYDHGRVSEYIVVSDQSRERLGRLWREEQILTRFSTPESAGEEVHHEIEFRRDFEDYYIGLVAVDENQNRGIISNIVNVRSFVGVGVTNVLDDDMKERSGLAQGVRRTSDTMDTESSLILALCGSFFLLALCLFGGVLYFLKCAKPRAPIMVDIGVSDDVTDPDNVSHCSSEIRNMTSEFPFLDLAGLGRGYSVTPTYWSASQLLHEHEARQDHPIYSRPSTLTPIKEEYLNNFTEFGDYQEIPDSGLTNLAYTSTPLKSGRAITPSVQFSTNIAVVETLTDTGSESVTSAAGSEGEERVERFSTGVQTLAPSCVARIRQSTDLVVHQRQSSLV